MFDFTKKRNFLRGDIRRSHSILAGKRRTHVAFYSHAGSNVWRSIVVMVDVIVDVLPTCAVVTADRDAMMEDTAARTDQPLQLISTRDGRGREGVDVLF